MNDTELSFKALWIREYKRLNFKSNRLEKECSQMRSILKSIQGSIPGIYKTQSKKRLVLRMDIQV